MSYVTNILGVSAPTVRFWMQKFDMEVRRGRGKANIRLFTVDDIEKLKQIRHLLKGRGFTIEGAKREMQYGR